MRPETLNPLFKPLSSLSGVGGKISRALTRFLTGRDSDPEARVLDLLFHLPNGVIDRRFQPKINEAREGVISTFLVHVDAHKPPPRGNKRVPYRVDAHDETGDMSLVFFRGHSEWLGKALPEGEQRYVSGRPEFFNGRLNMVHPDHILSPEEFEKMPLVEPVYGATKGVSSKVIAKAVRAAVSDLKAFPEWIDEPLLRREGWPSFDQAVRSAHHPQTESDIEPEAPGFTRLAYDEMLAGQLSLALVRNRFQKENGVAKDVSGKLVSELKNRLEFSLTGAQERAIAEIAEDLSKPDRMMRILQGDVGSGKTLVALCAALHTIEAGFQAALMVPTEVLARQHFATLSKLYEPLDIEVALLVGKDDAATRRAAAEAVASGAARLVIGTHALFQKKADFHDLGLVIIDEQHRFGVHQRLALGDKGERSDVLIMTATPIPRTLVLTNYGDMEVSRLDEMPPGRKPVTTSLLNSEKLEALIARIRQAVHDDAKVFWICPLVEESDEVDLISAEQRHSDLAGRLSEIDVGLVHGRMKPDQKEAAMDAFRQGDTRILVATTVIEVGVDVPDATIIVIEHAERFGLAQLHQLRGRVGRGLKPSSCVLLYSGPLSANAEARLKIMRETEDGFLIAEEDLKLRGGGEILGTRQSGTPGYRLMQPQTHARVLELARAQARLAIEKDPALSTKESEALRLLLYLFDREGAARLLSAG